MTTLEWSVDGSLLATGCMDGIARLWSREGVLQHSLNAHSESIFSLRFDSAGKRLLTGSYVSVCQCGMYVLVAFSAELTLYKLKDPCRKVAA